MRTDGERLALMHRRAAKLKRRRDRTLLHAWGGTAGALAVCLLCMMVAFYHGHGLSAETASGASMLSENAGGYVLVGVLAFMSGVVITVILKHRQKSEKDKR